MTNLHLAPSSPQPVSQLSHCSSSAALAWGGVSCRHQGGSEEMPQSRAPSTRIQLPCTLGSWRRLGGGSGYGRELGALRC